MDYKYLDSSINIENVNLQESPCINKFLLRNNYAEVIKAIDFFNTNGKLIKYKEGDGILYFDRDYNNVTVVYHGILCDEDDGLPLINDREMKAIAAFVAWREMLKDCLKRGTTSKYGLALVQTVEAEWLRKCNAARLTDHLTQNDMNAILDAKFSWNRKNYNKSFKPII